MKNFIIVTTDEGKIKVGHWNIVIEKYEFSESYFGVSELFEGCLGSKIELLTHEEMAERLQQKENYAAW